MEPERLSDPKGGAFSITPNDSTNLSQGAVALYVGTGGNIKITTSLGNTITFVNVPDGAVLPVRVARVYASGTDASNIIGLY